MSSITTNQRDILLSIQVSSPLKDDVKLVCVGTSWECSLADKVQRGPIFGPAKQCKPSIPKQSLGEVLQDRSFLWVKDMNG